MNQRMMELIATSRTLDNMLHVIRTLTPNEDTLFASHVFNVQTQGENLKYYIQEEIKKELSTN